MNRNFTLIGIFCLIAALKFSPLSATTYVDNGTATNYTLNTGDSLHIASGTYTGTIVSFATDAKISVAAGATFQPATMPFPSNRGTIYVYGAFVLNTQLRTNTGFTIHNYGVVTINNTILMSGTTQMWRNYFGATMNLNGDVSMTNDNVVYNQGTINTGANFTMTGTSALTNRLYVNINGNFLDNGGTVINQGRFYVKGSITFNNGLALIQNYCRMIAETGIYNTSGNVYNYGFLWSKSSPGTGVIVNSGMITNGPGAVILAISLNNTGTIQGSGYMHFTGTTTTTGMGTTGIAGATTDTLRMYDASRASLATIYDNQSGIVHPNVLFSQFTELDSNRAYIGGCSMEMVSQIPLAVDWNYFTATVKSQIPVLDWSAKADAGTVFEVQRSYNGREFYSISQVRSEIVVGNYQFNDVSANTKSAVIYYRIMAIDATGEKKYSATRSVKFGAPQSLSMTTSPNPFTSNLTLTYQSTEPGVVSIRIFDMNGQQHLIKNVNVNSGSNTIQLTEVARLPKGVYMVQLTGGNKVLNAEKIIKQ